MKQPRSYVTGIAKRVSHAQLSISKIAIFKYSIYYTYLKNLLSCLCVIFHQSTVIHGLSVDQLLNEKLVELPANLDMQYISQDSQYHKH